MTSVAPTVSGAPSAGPSISMVPSSEPTLSLQPSDTPSVSHDFHDCTTPSGKRRVAKLIAPSRGSDRWVLEIEGNPNGVVRKHAFNGFPRFGEVKMAFFHEFSRLGGGAKWR